MKKVIDIQNDCKILSNEKSNLSKIIKCLLNDELYYYKENEVFNGNIYPLNIAEVLACYVFDEVNYFNYVKYYFAKNGENSFGVISKNFIPKNNVNIRTTAHLLENYLYQHKYKKPFDINANLDKSKKPIMDALVKKCDGNNLNSIEMLEEIAETVCKSNDIVFDKNDFKKSLLRVAIMDYFTSNPDRNFSNLLFFVNSIDNEKLEFKLCPTFDNGYALGVRSFYAQKYDNITPKVFDNTDLALGITKKNQLIPVPYSANDLFITELIKTSNKYPEEKELINKFLDLDIEKVINKFEVKEDFKLDNDLRKYIIDTYNKRVENFKEIAQNDKSYTTELNV